MKTKENASRAFLMVPCYAIAGGFCVFKELSVTAKRDPIVSKIQLDCGECPEKWNDLLKSGRYGIPRMPEEIEARPEISETSFADVECKQIPLADLAGKQIKLGEEPPQGLAKVWGNDIGALETAPTARWKRSQSFMHIMGQIFASKNRLSKRHRVELLQMVADLVPNEPLPLFDPALWGSPEEFFERWKGHLVDVRFTYTNRGLQRFELWAESIPPDEPEDLDDAGEPSGHWDGLTWTPTPTKN
jgi:hypothetical protein